MSRKRFSVEQMIDNLREAEAAPARGQTLGGVRRRIGVSQQSYYRSFVRMRLGRAVQSETLNRSRIGAVLNRRDRDGLRGL